MSIRLVTCASTAMWLVACGGSTPPPEPPKKPAPEVQVVEQKVPDGAISRGKLEAVLREGPPWVLARVPIEEVMDGKKFVGWRIQEVPVAWDHVDLRAGDVVTTVNTMPLETPTDFWAAWTTLSVASELKVTYQREGQDMELSIPIVGMPNPELGEELSKDPKDQQGEAPGSPVPANQEYNDPSRRGTVTIKPDQKPLTDTLVDWSN
jgi:hypothetical protein